MTIGEFFGTLQQSVTATWRKHLQTGKYSKHMALDEYYTEMPEKIDALIEAWQSENGIVEDYTCILKAEDYDAVGYLEELKKIVKDGRELLGSSELESLCDDCLSLISSTLYKLKHLKEGLISLSEYLLTETIFDSDLTDEQVAAILAGTINAGRHFSLTNKTDSWGQPIEVGDILLGSVQNQLCVCCVKEKYRNGIMVSLDGNFTNQPLDLKRGFVKINPTLLHQIFPTK